MNEELAKLGIELDVSLHLRLFALVLARVLGMTMPVPFLGGNLVPARIRFGLPLFFSIFLYPFVTYGIPHHRIPQIGIIFMGYLAKEIFVGYCMGFVISLPFHAMSAAGSFMDTQRGTSFAQVIAPLTGGQSSLLGQFFQLLFIAIFLGIGGMGIVLDALGSSYAVIPILAVPPLVHPSAPAIGEFLRNTSEVFTITVQFAAPVVVAMFVTDATLGIVNRAAPNVQVFFLGMGLKAVGGLVMALALLAASPEYFAQIAVDMAVNVKRMLHALMAT